MKEEVIEVLENPTNKLKNTEDILNAVSLIDECHSIDNPISVIYDARYLLNALPTLISTVDTFVEHGLKVPEL